MPKPGRRLLRLSVHRMKELIRMLCAPVAPGTHPCTVLSASELQSLRATMPGRPAVLANALQAILNRYIARPNETLPEQHPTDNPKTLYEGVGGYAVAAVIF